MSEKDPYRTRAGHRAVSLHRGCVLVFVKGFIVYYHLKLVKLWDIILIVKNTKRNLAKLLK